MLIVLICAGSAIFLFLLNSWSSSTCAQLRNRRRRKSSGSCSMPVSTHKTSSSTSVAVNTLQQQATKNTSKESIEHFLNRLDAQLEVTQEETERTQENSPLREIGKKTPQKTKIAAAANDKPKGIAKTGTRNKK